MRTVIWFSCGAASAVAAYLTLKKSPDAVLVYCDTSGEHEDNKRFMRDVEKWLGKTVTVLKNEKYADHFDVCKKERYINGPNGARCTVELKKVLRFRFQEPDDVQVFGYTVEERERAARFGKAFPEVKAQYPLIENNLTKENCIGLIKQIGIEVPAMYKLGFNNNNCIGCVKGGMGYWNHIRKHFPETFDRMALLEREIGASCIRDIYLDELAPGRGDQMKEPSISCDFICQSVL